MSQFPSSNAGQGITSGIGVLGALFAGIGERQAGQQEQKAYDYNADITLQNTGAQQVASSEAYSALVGRQAVAYASAGVDITRGSPLLMMAATAGRGARQQVALHQAGTEEANLQRYYGKLSAFRGNIAGIGTFLKGLSGGATSYLSNTGYQPGGGNIPVVPNGAPVI